MNELKVTCKWCGKYQFTATTTTIQEEVPCGNSKCGAKSNYKIIFSNDFTDAQLHHVFTKEETPPKKLKKEEKA